MSDRLRYEISTAPAKLEAFRPDFIPRDNLDLCGNWPGCIVTGKSGKRYFFMLTIGTAAQPFTMFTNADVISDTGFDRSAPDIVAEIPMREPLPFTWERVGEEVIINADKIGKVHFRANGYDWFGFGDRIHLHVEHLGDACSYFIPGQSGVTNPVWHQSNVGWVTGHIDGDEIEGFSLLDLAWSPPDTTWFDIEIFRDIQKHWTMWVVEYENGRRDGGYAWCGKPGWKFDAGHYVEDGHTTATQTAITTPTYHETGVPEAIRIDYGDYWVECEYDCLADWPLHPIGRVKATSTGLPIAKSYTMTEWIPDNIKPIIDGTQAGFSEFRDIRAKPAKIVDGHVVAI